MKRKNALLIGGSGAIGSYTCEELVALGWQLDVITLDECRSTDQVTYYCMKASVDVLTEFLDGKRYDAIVDFLAYAPSKYPPMLELLSAHTDQLIFLSSYRVYSDLKHPITEDTPHILDITPEEVMLEQKQVYAWGKTVCERLIKASPYRDKVTIVRPVIAFCHKRLSFITLKAPNIMVRAGKKPMLVPREAKDVIAGFTFSGNVGKQIAYLCGKREALGEEFTLGGVERLTWGEIAVAFEEALGCEFVWVDTDTYLKYTSPESIAEYYGLRNDRLLNRDVDVSKVMRITELTEADLVPTLLAVRREAEIIKRDIARYTVDYREEIEKNQDLYFSEHGI